ncbi:MAG: GNAT family N-acetyltransferase [Myxococcales bacterium]|nr:GNAT family N-acetyltransferase [Myxococcales bacterium]
MNPQVLSDADWSACHALHSAAHAERGTVPATLEAYRGQHNRALRAGEQLYWLAREGDSIIGKADLYFRDPKARTQGSFAIYVAADHRRKGAATALLRQVFDAALSRSCDRLDVGTDSDAGRALCEQAGGELQQELTQRVLELEALDWALVDRWISEGEARAQGASIEVIGELPEAEADNFVRLWSAVSADVPQPPGTPRTPIDLQYRRSKEAIVSSLGWKLITLVVREADGTLSALGDIMHDPRAPDLVRQDLTGVHPDYRGRGRARWLKASLLRRLAELCPGARRVTTNNADTNAAMVAINRRLGYVDTVRQSIYRFDTESFRARLG